MPLIQNHSQWLVGNGKSVRFWLDNWLGFSIIDAIDDCNFYLDSMVSDYVVDGKWMLPTSVIEILGEIVQLVVSYQLSSDIVMLIWPSAITGEFSMKCAYDSITSHKSHSNMPSLWESYIPTNKSLLVWRLYHHKMPTQD